MENKRTSLSRRSVLIGGGAASLVPGLVRAGKPAPPAKEAAARLWYRQPAARWEEALPLGNGRLGAMVFGRVAQERLQLNEDTLWAGSPYVPDPADASAALRDIRAQVAASRYKEAEQLAGARFMAKPLTQMPYGTLGDVLIDFLDATVPDRYRRELDLETAVASTEFQTLRGRFRREAFVSAVDQVIVLRLDGPRGGLDFDLGYRGPRVAKGAPPGRHGVAADWLLREAAGDPRPDNHLVADGPGAWLITGKNETGAGVDAGLTYALRVKVVSDGRIEIADGALRLRGGSHATLLMSAATSYVNARDMSGDPVRIVRAHNQGAASKPYARLKRDHVRDHQALYKPVSLQLGKTNEASQPGDQPTDERIAAAETSDDPSLAALYFQFARYLLISCSRPGTQPANLQGLWNEGISPPWGSKFTININTEMNYWPADPAGLGACVEPLLRMVEELSVTGTRTARTMYDARGWVAHHNTDLWRASAPVDGPVWGLWPCGGAWLCNTLWDHYDYARSEATLRRLYPLMKGASQFFLDTLIEDPAGRGLITSPSISPENRHPFGSSVCAGPAMDRQIIRDLFAHTVEAGQLLSMDAHLLIEIDQARSRLAPDAIGKQGQLQEWLEDWDADAPDPQHRHVSHLYAVYPSSQINVRDTPRLGDAAKVSLRQRGDLATGWGTAWRLCLWARMGEGDHAHAVLKSLLGPRRTYPNMFDAHPPFQIDGNFGGAAGILEMLVQSWGGEIRLLPALPQVWADGSVRGIKARGGITIDMTWVNGQLQEVRLAGPPDTPVRLHHNGRAWVIRTNRQGFFRLAPIQAPAST